MKLPRRRFLRMAASVAVLPTVPRFAWAQAYPSRPVRMIVPFPVGGNVDITAPLIGQWLSERLGHQFFIDNRVGAGANIGTEAAVRAPPDGHTLLLASATNTINAASSENLNFDFIRDTVAIASINLIPIVLEVNPSFPARSVPEFIAYAKSNPAKVNLATPPKGTGPYMAAQLFMMMAGVDLVVVPYRGNAPMLNDLLGGHVQVAFGGISVAIEHIRAGKLHALAVASAARLETFPDVATIAESVPGFEASGWCGIVAPRDTPVAIIEKLNKEVNAGLADPKIKERLADLLVPVLAGSPADFANLIAREKEKWAKVVKFAGIKLE